MARRRAGVTVGRCSHRQKVSCGIRISFWWQPECEVRKCKTQNCRVGGSVRISLISPDFSPSAASAAAGTVVAVVETGATDTIAIGIGDRAWVHTNGNSRRSEA
jgi:hypothetical protein